MTLSVIDSPYLLQHSKTKYFLKVVFKTMKVTEKEEEMALNYMKYINTVVEPRLLDSLGTEHCV